MNTVNKLDELSLEDIRRLEKNSFHYHEYRNAVAEVFNLLPKNLSLPFDFAVALGNLQRIHERVEGEM